MPNVGASPNGPFRFNVNVQGLLSVFNTTTRVDTGETLNMNRGVQFENVGQKLFNTTPIAIAFKRSANEGFVVLGGTDRLVRVVFDASGAPTINAPTALLPPGTLSDIVRIPVGKNPQGIAINSTDTRAYVMNFISRDVSVVDISGTDPKLYHEIARIPSAALPTPGTLAAIILRGNELFNTSLGPAGTLPTSTRARGPHVRHRLGQLLQLPPARAHRRRDVDVPRRPAPDDLDGEHRRAPAAADLAPEPERRAAAAAVLPARAQLVRGARRDPGLRAQHPRACRAAKA